MLHACGLPALAGLDRFATARAAGVVLTHRFLELRPFMLKLLAFLLLAQLTVVAQAADITAYTDDSAAFHLKTRGTVSLTPGDMLKAACARARLSCEIKVLPWARAYVLASTTPNTLLIAIVRRPDRERDFIWLSPIESESVWAFGRTDSPPLKAIGDLRSRHTGVINGGSGERFLRDAGIPEAAMDKANSLEANFRKLGAGRIDYVIDTEARLAAARSRFNIKFDTVKVLKLHDITTYFAINPASDPLRVRALQAAFANK